LAFSSIIFFGDVVQRLVPAHALEAALAALADAHHRIEQALGRIQARTVGAAAQAGAQLRLLDGVLAEGAALLVAAVVG
jgi:polyhydroxyalkanoate synthesis regulator protein